MSKHIPGHTRKADTDWLWIRNKPHRTAGLYFQFQPGRRGFNGLVTGKPAAAVYTRAGIYDPATGMDSYDPQKPCLEKVLGFIGFEDIRSAVIEETLAPPAAKDRNVAAANEQARQIARTF